MEEEKVKEILNQLTPKKVKNIQKFLGLANYYQKFIKDFMSIARLLYNLVKKDQKYNWTKKILRKLKKRVIKIKIARRKNKEVIKVVEEIKKVKIKVLKGDE